MISRRNLLPSGAAITGCGFLASTWAGPVLAQQVSNGASYTLPLEIHGIVDYTGQQYFILGGAGVLLVLIVWGVVVRSKRKREQAILDKKKALNRRFHSR